MSVAQGEESQVILQVGDAADYAVRKDAYHSQGLKLVPVNLGREAFVVNDAQLIAIDDQNRSISLGLSLVVFGGEPPLSSEEIAAGIERAGGEVLATCRRHRKRDGFENRLFLNRGSYDHEQISSPENHPCGCRDHAAHHLLFRG